MDKEDPQKLFSSIRAFEWDEKKRVQNLKKHGIDFDDARLIFDGPTLVMQSIRKTETRYAVLGFVEESKSPAHSARTDAASFQQDEPEPMREKNFTVVSRGAARQGKTDWKRVRKLTDAEIGAAVKGDDDWSEFKDFDWSKADLILPARKKAISIRVDEDVLKFFKHGGEGYQRRINAVLRSFMQASRKKEKA